MAAEEIPKPKEGGLTTLQLISTLSIDAKTRELTLSRVVTYARARELRIDPTIKLARMLCVAPALASDWSIEASDDAPEGAEEQIAKWALPIKQKLLKMVLFSLIDYGWCGAEKIWQLDTDGLYTIKDIVGLLVDITSILADADSGDFAGFLQKFSDANGKEKKLELEPARSMLFNQWQEGSNFYGESDFTALDATQVRYDNVMDIADQFDAKSAGGIWIIRYPAGTSIMNGIAKDNGAIARELLSVIKANGGLAIPSTFQSAVGSVANTLPYNKIITANDWEIELKESSGASSTHLLDKAQYLDTLKVRGLGMPERAILEGRHGTKADAEAHADVALTFADDRHEYVLARLNSQCVDQALAINYGPEAVGTVRVIASPVGADEKLFLRSLYTTILSNSSLSLLDFDKIDMAALRDLIGIPSQEGDDETEDRIEELPPKTGEPIA